MREEGSDVDETQPPSLLRTGCNHRRAEVRPGGGAVAKPLMKQEARLTPAQESKFTVTEAVIDRRQARACRLWDRLCCKSILSISAGNNDSKELVPRFDNYKVLFHETRLATFATQSDP